VTRSIAGGGAVASEEKLLPFLAPWMAACPLLSVDLMVLLPCPLKRRSKPRTLWPAGGRLVGGVGVVANICWARRSGDCACSCRSTSYVRPSVEAIRGEKEGGFFSGVYSSQVRSQAKAEYGLRIRRVRATWGGQLRAVQG
jgi:hypothetical protein